jgi:aminotransferase EvaB
VNRIPTFDLLAQLAEIRGEVLEAVTRVLDSGQVILGPEVAGFEREFASGLGEGMHGVGVASGTAALALALRALGVGPGDEVVTVANTAVATVAAIRELGAKPVFCDVREDTALLDLDQLSAVLSPHTRAVVPVHLYGNPVDVPALRERVGGDVAVVEDCAQSAGATLRGMPTGTMGDAAAFSFYPTKNLGAYGDAGLCATRDAGLAETMRRLRSYGLDAGDAPPAARLEGVNARLDELQAAILRVKLPHLSLWVERRRALAERYRVALPAAARGFETSEGARHARHLFVVRVPRREALRRALGARGIATAVHYPVPIHHMPAYAFLGRPSLPVTERLAGELLTLPLYPELGESEVDRVCAALREALS